VLATAYEVIEQFRHFGCWHEAAAYLTHLSREMSADPGKTEMVGARSG
jgi:hypothetical protein